MEEQETRLVQGKYYWLRLKENFFDQNEIKIIEGLKNGKEYVLFYMKLMCLSIKNEGHLRVNDSIPYDEETLASATHTDIDAVRSAIEVLVRMQLVEVLEDKTLFLYHVQQLIGKEQDAEEIRRKNAIRQQRYRDRLKEQKSKEITGEQKLMLESENKDSDEENRNVTGDVTVDVTCNVKSNGEKRVNNQRDKSIKIEGGKTIPSDNNSSDLMPQHIQKYLLSDLDYSIMYYESLFGKVSKSIRAQIAQLVQEYQRRDIVEAMETAAKYDPKYPMQYIKRIIYRTDIDFSVFEKNENDKKKEG